MIVIVVGLLLVGLTWFVRNNTQRGAETVRAYLYLGLLERGMDALEANRAVANVYNSPPDVVRATKLVVVRRYGGKQLAMVAEAYSRRMLPNLPIGSVRKIAALYAARGAGDRKTTPDAAFSKLRVSHSKLTEATSGGHSESEFRAYYNSFVAALKRCEGLSDDEIHPVELMEDDPLKRAFRDRVDIPTLVGLYIKEHRRQ